MFPFLGSFCSFITDSASLLLWDFASTFTSYTSISVSVPVFQSPCIMMSARLLLLEFLWFPSLVGFVNGSLRTELVPKTLMPESISSVFNSLR